MHSKKRNRLSPEHTDQRLYIYWNGKKLNRSMKFDVKRFELRGDVINLRRVIAGAAATREAVRSKAQYSGAGSLPIDVSSGFDDCAVVNTRVGSETERDDGQMSRAPSASTSSAVSGGESLSIVTDICPANTRRHNESHTAGKYKGKGKGRRRPRRRGKHRDTGASPNDDGASDSEAMAIALARSRRDQRESRAVVRQRSRWEATHCEEGVAYDAGQAAPPQ